MTEQATTKPRRRRFKMPAVIEVNVTYVQPAPGTNPWQPFLELCARKYREQQAAGRSA